MAFPYAPHPDPDGPGGETYAVVLVRTDDAGPAKALLQRVRFTGWIAPAEDGWLPVLAVPGAGAVATRRRGVVDLGATLAAELATTVLAIRVLADRQLALVAWTRDEELGRYVSDPSREPGADEDVLPDPLGDEDASGFAAACGRPERGGELAEVLAERLDTDSFIESERLSRVLRLLGLPTWLVAAAALPRDIPTGPPAREITRLGYGLPGPLGVVCARAALVVRRRRRPRPVIADPPRGGSGMDPWLF
jgi:hypothetical protein